MNTKHCVDCQLLMAVKHNRTVRCSTCQTAKRRQQQRRDNENKQKAKPKRHCLQCQQELTGRARKYCSPECKTLHEATEGTMIKTILGGLKRGSYGYANIKDAWPQLTDLYYWLNLRRQQYQLGDTQLIQLSEPITKTNAAGETTTKTHRSIWIPSPFNIAHRIPFRAGGSLAQDNIFLLEQGANKGYRDGYETTYRHKPITRPVELFTQGNAAYGDGWFDRLREMLGRQEQTFNTVRKAAKQWRQAIADAGYHQALEQRERKLPDGKTRMVFTHSEDTLRHLLGIPIRTADNWLLVGLGLVSKDDDLLSVELYEDDRQALIRSAHQGQINKVYWHERLNIEGLLLQAKLTLARVEDTYVEDDYEPTVIIHVDHMTAHVGSWHKYRREVAYVPSVSPFEAA